MRRRHLWLIAAIILLGLWLWSHRLGNGATRTEPAPESQGSSVAVAPAPATAPAPVTHDTASRYPAFLPVEAHDVLERIDRGGPFAYRQDGGVFGNRERRLPPQPNGYYHEYTVDTPGSDDRGARRIITGGGIPGASPPIEYWYTDDHYRSFRRFELPSGKTSQ